MSDSEQKVISGDGHLEIDSRWWLDYVPEEHRSRAPRVIKLPEGGDAWLIEGAPVREVPQDLYGGKGRDSWKPFGQSYETTAGTGPASQRLTEQDEDGIDGEVLFPGASGPGLWRNIKDDNAYRAVVRAYNTYLADDYCSVAPDRLIGVGVLPQTGVDDAIAEMKWCQDHHLRGVLLSRFPNGTGVPKLEDDRFWAAALDSGMALTIHGQINRGGATTLIEYPNAHVAERIPSGAHAQFAEQTTKMARDPGVNAIQLTLSGVFDRFPELRIFLAETQIGWIPLFLNVADQRFRRHSGWAEQYLGWSPLKKGLPSEYIREHCLWGFQEDPIGIELRRHIGVENLIWATDFPHQESEWPNSRDVLKRNFDGVPADEVRLMTCDNVQRFFHMD